MVPGAVGSPSGGPARTGSAASPDNMRALTASSPTSTAVTEDEMSLVEGGPSHYEAAPEGEERQALVKTDSAPLPAFMPRPPASPNLASAGRNGRDVASSGDKRDAVRTVSFVDDPEVGGGYSTGEEQQQQQQQPSAGDGEGSVKEEEGEEAEGGSPPGSVRSESQRSRRGSVNALGSGKALQTVARLRQNTERHKNESKTMKAARKIIAVKRLETENMMRRVR